jgi:hypothetical protein
MQRTVLAAAALMSAVLLHAGPAHAQTYPWCAQFNGGYGGPNCGFSTLRQCRASVRGVGGICVANPLAPGSAYQTRRRSRQQFW